MEEKRGGWSPSIFAVIVALWIIGFGYTFCMQQSHLNEVEEDRAVAISRLEEARNRNAALKEERDGLQKPEYIPQKQGLSTTAQITKSLRMQLRAYGK